MAAKKVDINIKTTADTTGVKQTTAAVDGLTTATKANSTAINTTTANTGRMGQVAQGAGYQIQDFAVQVGGGTSALVAFSQQAPQLLGVFGPAGAIAGAVVAIGAIATKVFLGMAEGAQQTGEEFDKLASDLEKAFGEKAKKLVAEFADEIDALSTGSKTLREAELALYETRNLQAETNAKLIGSNLALDEAGINYLKTIGLVVDEEKALLAVRNEAATKTTDAAIAAENAKIENARAKYNSAAAEYQDAQDQIAAAEKRLAELEQKQQDAIARKEISGITDAMLVQRGDLKEGQTTIGTQAIQKELDTLKTQIKGVYEIVQSGPTRLAAITDQASAQAAQLDVSIATAENAISEITQKADLTARTAELTAATTQITTDAKEITAQIAKVEAITPLQQEAKAQITQLASDGVITAQDQIKIGQNLNVLQNSLKTGQVESLTTIRSLIEVNNQMAIKMSAMSQQIKSIQSKVQNIK
jgi:hypothetical protein